MQSFIVHYSNIS